MKKFSFIWLFVLMSICVIGANAEGEVAQIGETKYATVAEAFAAVGDGETIELLSDASFDSEIVFDEDIAFTLDGGGYTLTDNGTDQASGTGATGTYSGIKITAGHLTVTNITFERNYKKQYAVLSLYNNAKLTVSDNVAFNAIQGGSGAAIRSEDYAEVEISGKNVTMINCNAWGGVIYMLEFSTATIEDVEITATSSIARNGIGLANNPKLTLKKGTISGYAKAGIGVGSDNTDASVGAACVVDIYDEVTICCTTGIATKGSAAAKINVSCNIENATTGIDVAGGTLDFNGAIKDCPTGINASDGTLKVSGGTIENCERGIGVKKEKSVIVGGEANLTDNDSNIVLGEGSKIILEEDFCGTIGIVGSENQAGTAFGEISEDLNGIVENVFNDENTELVACASEGKLLWKKMATVTIEDFEAKTYGDASFEVVLENADDFSDFTYSSSDPDVASVSDSGIITIYKAGETDIAVEFGGNDTYAPATDVKTLTIAKLAITITADNSFKIKGESDPEFTYTYTPELVEGDVFKGSLERSEGEANGEYTITQGTLTVDNSDSYDISFVPGVFIIDEKYSQFIEVPEEMEVTYGDEDFYIEAECNPEEFENPLIYISSDENVVEVDEEGKVTIRSAGSATITVSRAGNESYNDTEATVNIIVNKKDITVSADNKKILFGEDEPELTYTYEGILTEGDGFTGNLIREEGDAAGEYDIIQGTLSLSDNYNLIYEKGIFTIAETCTVSAEAEHGTVTGTGAVEKDTKITLKAEADKGYYFAGWYYDDKLMTMKESYTFTVRKDLVIEAKFKKSKIGSGGSSGSGGSGSRGGVPSLNGAVSTENTKRTILLYVGKTEATVFGNTVVNDVAPVVKNDRTMLPARFVAESLGATVTWDEAGRKVIIAKNSLLIEITIDSDTALVNGRITPLDSPAFIENDRTYMPLRFIVENLGATVIWDKSEQKVTITVK